MHAIHNRTLSISAYQSLIFNKAVSIRIQVYGHLKVVAGDLVAVGAEVLEIYCSLLN